MTTETTTGLIARGAHVSEWVETADGLMVHRYSICGTDRLDYRVYERMPVNAQGRHTTTHSTFTYHDGVALGDITTRQLPAELDALPAYSTERSNAVSAWLDAQEAEARAIIQATFPRDFAR